MTTSLDQNSLSIRSQYISATQPPRATSCINLVAVPTEDVEQTIVDTARKLEDLRAPPNQVGIQFLQIGQNKQVAKWLKMLEDKLHEIHKVKDVSFALKSGHSSC